MCVDYISIKLEKKAKIKEEVSMQQKSRSK